jgi:hypothetical protein
MTWSGALAALPTLGTSITLVEIKGAVTMKMIKSTSMTSMKGTMLISFMVRLLERDRCAKAAMA